MKTIETYTIDYYIYTLHSGQIFKSTIKDKNGIKSSMKVELVKDDESGEYIAYLPDTKGGPIISGVNIDYTKKQFIKALDALFFIEAINSLNNFF